MRAGVDWICWALSVLLLTLCGDTWDDCDLGVNVPRNTAIEARAAEALRVQCRVTHCGRRFNVSWCKIDAANVCHPINETEYIRFTWENSRRDKRRGSAYLHFASVVVNDSGLYRCGSSGIYTTISHSINVTVVLKRNLTLDDTTDGPKLPDTPNHVLKAWLPYIIPSVVILLIILMLLCLVIQRYAGTRSSEKPQKPQYQYQSCEESLQPDISARPRSVRANTTAPADPGQVYGNASIRRPSRTHRTQPTGRTPDTFDCVSNEISVAEFNATVYDNDRSSKAKEESNTIVYAALNLKTGGKDAGPIRSSTGTDEHSEYAAIRLF